MSTPKPIPTVDGPADNGSGVIGWLNGAAGAFGTWLLAATVLFMPLNTLRPIKEIAVADLLIVLLLPVAFFLFLTRFVLRKRFGQFPWWLWAGALLLIASIALVELVPPDGLERLAASFDIYGLKTEPSVVIGIQVIFALVAFPVAISVIVDRWSTVDLLLSLWIAGVAISCAVAVLDSFFGFDIQSALAYDPDGIRGYLMVFPGEANRMVGLTDHPNTLNLTALMVSPLVMARMKSRRGLLRYGPVLLLITLGVLLSGARSGVVGLVLAAALTVLMDERIRNVLRNLQFRTVIAIAAILVCLTALLSVGVNSSPESTAGKLVPSSLSRMLRPMESGTSISDNERESYIDDSITYIGERPLAGYGFEWVESSHNTVLQLLLAGGPLALVGFYLVLIGYLNMGFRLRFRIPDGMGDSSVALTVSLLLYAISGLVDNHVFERYLYIPAGLILAMYLLQKMVPR